MPAETHLTRLTRLGLTTSDPLRLAEAEQARVRWPGRALRRRLRSVEEAPDLHPTSPTERQPGQPGDEAGSAAICRRDRPDAPKAARAALVQVLVDRRSELAEEETYQALIEDRRKIMVRTLDVPVRPGLAGDSRTEEIQAAPENVDDLFRSARRRLREGVRDEYFRHRVKVDDADPEDATIEAFLLANDGVALTKSNPRRAA